jgi:DnaJ family protein C protein 3
MHLLKFTFRNASKQQILKAYRKLAVKWHPDKYEDSDKKQAEKMFIDIAAAKEVLTDPGKLPSLC